MKRAILTGASSGIGAAITKELLMLDYEVYGFGRSFPGAPEENYLSALLPGVPSDRLANFHAVRFDLTKTGALAERVREIRKEGRISLLVNNAGVGYFGLHEELSPAMLHEMVTVNLEVPMLLCRLLLRDLKETGGHIIELSSVTARKSSPHGCAYGATKAALTAFSGSLFDEVRKYGVRVTCIHPDMTKSNFYRSTDFGPEEDADCSLSPGDVAAAVRCVLTARDGLVVSDLTLLPQKHRIARKNQKK